MVSFTTQPLYLAGGLHNKELRDLHPSSNIIWVIKSRRMRGTGHVARTGDWRGAYRALVGRPEGKRSFERRKGNIKMDLLK